MARHSGQTRRIGLIADTHGLLRPEALEALRGVDHIIHAGDVGSPEVLEGLQAIAPVTAVRGNNDIEGWAQRLPLSATLKVSGFVFYVIHELAHLRTHAAPENASVIVTGHSHRPLIESRDGVLFVNPGSAGPRRFKLPVTVALAALIRGKLQAEILELNVAPPKRS